MRDVQQSVDGSALAELLAFIAVAEELSFSRAGARLARDATVVSRRVTALETRLGVRLLERTTRSVALTEAGRAYLLRARALIEAFDEADQEARDLAEGEPRGHLRLALPGTFGRQWLARPLAAFLAAHPRITVEAEFSNRYVDLVGERFDLAIRLGELTDSRLAARRLAPRRRFLCASPAYLARAPRLEEPGDLAHHDCIVFAGAPRWKLVGRDGETANLLVRGRVMTDEAEVLVEMATAGLGVLMGTDWLAAHALADGALVKVLPRWRIVDEGAIYLLTASGSHRASKTRAFSDFITAYFRAPPWMALETPAKVSRRPRRAPRVSSASPPPRSPARPPR